MKAAAAILLLIIASNNLFYYTWFQASMMEIKSGAQQTISQVGDNEIGHMLRVPVSELDRDELDEVWYRGKLYDVVKRETGKTNCVFVLEDEKEENLLAAVCDFFRSDDAPALPSRSLLKSLKLNHCGPAFKYTIASIQWNAQQKQSAPSNYYIPDCSIYAVCSEVSIPPPKTPAFRRHS